MLAVVGAYLLYPALTPAHVEGFTASIVSLALHLRDGDIAAYDRLYGANLEFFALSRMGTNLMVAALSQGLGLSGDGAFRLGMWVCEIAFAVGTYALVRRWTGASGAWIAAMLLLLPGVTDTTYIYNDNVVASGLVVTSLAIAAASPRTRWWVVAGVLFGLAVLARTDAVLLSLALPLLAFEQDRSSAAMVRRGVAVGVAAAVVYLGILAVLGTQPFDVLAASQYAVYLWQRGRGLITYVMQIVLFMGVSGLALVALGAWRVLRRREYLRLALLVGVPFVFGVVNLGKLWEGRQLLPLTPFLVALAVGGGRYLFGELRSGTARVWQAALVVVTLGLWLAPREPRPLDDGPRTYLGRLWSPPVWRTWQRTVDTDLARLHVFADSVGGPAPVALITDVWNDDRYLHLALQESGFRVAPRAKVVPACAAGAELFERGGQRVLHVRMHTPFLPNAGVIVRERFDALAQPCLAATRPAAIYFLGAVDELEDMFPGRLPASDPWLARVRADSGGIRLGYHQRAAMRLDSAGLAQLGERYTQIVTQSLSYPWLQRGHARTLEQAERILGPQVHFPR